jgi:hypothetical protein
MDLRQLSLSRALASFVEFGIVVVASSLLQKHYQPDVKAQRAAEQVVARDQPDLRNGRSDCAAGFAGAFRHG